MIFKFEIESLEKWYYWFDGLVNGAGTTAKEASKTLRLIQTGNVGFYIFMMVAGIVALLIYGFYYLA